MTTRMDLEEYRARTAAPKRNKYGAIRSYRCRHCNAHSSAPLKKPKRGPAPTPEPCPACGKQDLPLSFDSKAEARHWDNLVLLEKAGKIQMLKRQVSFDLHAAPRNTGYALPLVVGQYKADFTHHRDGSYIVET